MLKYIFSQHLRTPERQNFSLFYRKDLRPGLRIILKKLKFQYQEWQLEKSRTGFFSAFTSVLCSISGHKRGHSTVCLTDSSERALDSS